MDKSQLTRQGVAQAVNRLRVTFNSGKTKTLKWRKEQLCALRLLLDEQEEALIQALKQDFSKATAESLITEIAFVKGEIRYALRKLKKWLKPKHPIMPLSLQPAAGKLVYEPLGVVLIISPWNYPVMLLLSPLVGALAAGNAVVLKPSEVAPAVADCLAHLIPRYLDKEAIEVLQGGPQETEYILDVKFDYIFYTGNEHVARIVSAAAAKHLTPVTLELGGKSPAWVGDKVPLKQVADRLVWAKFINAGQTCVAPDYILATPKVADQLVPYLQDSIVRFYGTEPKKSSDYCRIIDSKHVKRLSELLDDLSPGQIMVGGEIDAADNYIAPTIIDHVNLTHKIMGSEIFGPLLPIVRVKDFDAALAIIQSRDKPLVLYAFTKDRREKERLVRETSSGALGLNIAVAHLSASNLPFGGVGLSGQGHYHGHYSFTTFSHLKPILSKPLRPDTMKFIYAPYGVVIKLIAKWLIGR